MANQDFYVVGIGTSAGGLEALERFFKQMPVTDRLAFLVIQHLSPDYKSHMVELLSKYTDIPVHQASDGVSVKPGNIYLLPPRNNMTIFNGKLYLVEYDRSRGLNLPIDILFESLAKDQKNYAIGCILSGTGSDGTRGIRAIKENGGFVIAQNDSARFDGMPRSAIATQLVDYISTPEDMAGIILRFIEHPTLSGNGTQSAFGPERDLVGKVLAILSDRNNMDFTGYKQNTLIRRIERRMSLLDVGSLDGYIQHIQKSETERNILCKEFLIGVTRFFRDTEAFEFLQTDVIPDLINSKDRNDQIRVWVPGCSTGEEAYSLAILFQDYMERSGKLVDVKIFATDIDRDALERAGRGRFPESVIADIPAALLAAYFDKEGDHYEILRKIRSMVVFAYQNIITDPPFSRIDLVTCRNLLIYLQPDLQRHILGIFQFALRSGGHLFLGSSESLGDKAPEFTVVHSKWKIYRYRGENTQLASINLNPSKDRNPVQSSFREPAAQIKPVEDWRRSEPLLRALVENVLPPCVVVDENWNMVHSFGDSGEYLHAPRGYQVNLNIMKLVRETISIPLSTALHRTFKDGSDVIYRRIQVEKDKEGHAQYIDLTTRRLWTQGGNNYALILFIPHDDDDQVVDHADIEIEDFKLSDGVSQRIDNLEQELQYTRENLQATIEELETSNEELQATNEELMAANEELQSTNEELESVNEELLTVNNEYQVKIRELTALNDDMNNLLNSIDFGVVFLDSELRVRKFTPAAQRAINLMTQDIGRPIHHLSHNLGDFQLEAAIQDVIDKLVSGEHQVWSKDDEYFLLRITPYRTHNNQINGVVLTLADITELQEALEYAQHSDAFAESILNSLTAQIAVLDADGVIVRVNEAWRDFAVQNGGDPKTTDVGVNYLEVCRTSTGLDAREAPESYEGLRALLDGDIEEFDLEYPCHAPDQKRWFLMRAVPLAGSISGVVVSHINVTRAKVIENALRLSEKRFRLATLGTRTALFEQDTNLNYTWVYNADMPFPDETALNLSDEELLSDDEARIIAKIKRRVLREGTDVDEQVQLTINGYAYTCQMVLEPIIDEEDHIIGLVGAFNGFDPAT